MSLRQVCWNPTTSSATVQEDGAIPPSGSTVVGTFTHPDEVGDELGHALNHVTFHHVRDILYHIDVFDMGRLTITDEITGAVWNGMADGLRLIEIGDSFIANGSNTSVGFENYGIVTAAMRFSGQKLYRNQAQNYGLGGDDTLEVEARFDSQVVPTLTMGGGLAIIHCGTNDGANLTVDQTLDSMLRMRNALLSMKIPVIFVTVEPRGNSIDPTKRYTGEALARHLERRTRMLAELPKTGCVVVDPRAVLLEPATENDLKLAYSHDALHPNPIGATEAWGPLLATAIDQLVADYNVIDATLARSTNRDMTGTGGSLGTDGSGTMPTGFSGANATGTTGVTRTYSTEEIEGETWQKCVVGGVAATANAAIDLWRQTAIQAILVPGKTYEVVAKYRIAAGATNLLSVQCGHQIVSPTLNETVWDSDRYVEGQPISALAQEGIFKGPRFVAPEGATDLRIRFAAYLSTAGAPAATVYCRELSLQEVLEP